MTEQVIQLGNLCQYARFKDPQRGRVYSVNGISPCLNGLGMGGNLEPKIIVYE